MTWALFLDDERFPPDEDPRWRIARNVDDAMYFIKTHGLPEFMSLDHDLGYGKQTGMDFCKLFADYCMNNNINTSSIDFYVHSQNPVGKQNMESYFLQFLREWDGSHQTS